MKLASVLTGGNCEGRASVRSVTVLQSLQSHACTRSQCSVAGCMRLTVIEDEVSQAYPVGVIALKVAAFRSSSGVAAGSKATCATCGLSLPTAA